MNANHDSVKNVEFDEEPISVSVGGHLFHQNDQPDPEFLAALDEARERYFRHAMEEDGMCVSAGWIRPRDKVTAEVVPQAPTPMSAAHEYVPQI